MEGLWRKISPRGRFSVAGRMTVLREERPPGGRQAATHTEGTVGQDVARWSPAPPDRGPAPPARGWASAGGRELLPARGCPLVGT